MVTQLVEDSVVLLNQALPGFPDIEQLPDHFSLMVSVCPAHEEPILSFWLFL